MKRSRSRSRALMVLFGVVAIVASACGGTTTSSAPSDMMGSLSVVGIKGGYRSIVTTIFSGVAGLYLCPSWYESA